VRNPYPHEYGEDNGNAKEEVHISTTEVIWVLISKSNFQVIVVNALSLLPIRILETALAVFLIPKEAARYDLAIEEVELAQSFPVVISPLTLIDSTIKCSLLSPTFSSSLDPVSIVVCTINISDSSFAMSLALVVHLTFVFSPSFIELLDDGSSNRLCNQRYRLGILIRNEG
jgi:hypothetical protein